MRSNVASIFIHLLNDGIYYWIYYGSFFSLDPLFDLQKNANSDTFLAETEASYLQSIPAFSKHFRTSRIVALAGLSLCVVSSSWFRVTSAQNHFGPGHPVLFFYLNSSARDILVHHYKLSRAPVIDASRQ